MLPGNPKKMTTRRPLQKQLFSAWTRAINEQYINCQINSERSLQAALWNHLLAELPANRRTFIEPRIRSLSGADIPKLYPDLIICDSRSVIGVLELKYTPRVKPCYKKDLRTLGWLAEHRDDIYVENSRFLGASGTLHRYTFADNSIFGWASIHKLQSPQLNAKVLAADFPALSNRFFEFHAETTDEHETVIGRSAN